MIYSKSSEYAIRACIHLARVPEGKCAMVKDVAKDESIPAHFLAKILQSLARKGLLKSTKGPSGGFCLRLPSRTLKLLDIVAAVDGLEQYERCVAGLPRCLDSAPCPMHKNWTRLRSRIISYLETNSVGELSRSSLGQAGRAGTEPGRRDRAKRV